VSILDKIYRHTTEKARVDGMFLRARCFVWLFNKIPDFYVLAPLRNLFLKWGGAQIDIFHAYIRSPFWCSDLKGVQFGKGVFINMGCRFEGSARTTIGDHCQIGPFCCFENVNHTAAGDLKLPISIGSGVWLGARVVVTPGAEVGNNCVIAAGAVVSKTVPSGELWGWVPAKKIKDVAPVQ
jgi:maltose O-acetyltransferase